MNLTTARHPWRKLKATNFTDNGFAARQSTLTRPSGNYVVYDLPDGTQTSLNTLLLRPFGTATNNNTFSIRVLGWDKELTTGSWEFQILCELACTLGNIQGTASCAIAAADFEADTIAVTYGNANVSVEAVSPANDVRGAVARIDTYGAQIVECLFTTGGVATSMNVLWKRA